MKSIKITAAILAIVFATASAFTPKSSVFVDRFWYQTDATGANITGLVDPSNLAISKDQAITNTSCNTTSTNFCAKAYVNQYTGSFPASASAPGTAVDNLKKD